MYAKQIISGLSYLHENKVLHKDIKGANILVNKDGMIKLSDFGCSVEIERTLSTQTGHGDHSLQGSIPWIAPEVVTRGEYGRRSDIWSLGCTILEMASGKCPWSQYNLENPFLLIRKIGETDDLPEIPDHLSTELKNLIMKCLNRDSKQRPYAPELLEHKFFDE